MGGPDFDILFGPAYKGIPLAAGTAIALAQKGRDVPYAFDRKEAKDHGEGGDIVGALPPGTRVMILDDVITAGSAIRGSVELLRGKGCEVIGVVVAADREEKGAGEGSFLLWCKWSKTSESRCSL